MSVKSFKALVAFTAIIIALVVSAIIMASDSEDGAKRALEAHGFVEIQLTGYRWIGCNRDENYRMGFQAKDAKGKPVTGVVCRGLLTGGSVRID
jgi:hypothetical protein